MTHGGPYSQGGRNSPRGTWADEGRALSVVRWLRDPAGDWAHVLVTGRLVAKTASGVRLLVNGAEREFAVKEGWHVCTS